MGKFISWMILVFFVTTGAWWFNPDLFADFGLERNDVELVMRAWERKQSNIVVEVDAQVALVLPDRHDLDHAQRFLVRLENGHRLMVSHNLEVSTHVPVGQDSLIRVRGEYDWTESGGIIHWTHRDVSGARDGGWIEHGNRRYQ